MVRLVVAAALIAGVGPSLLRAQPAAPAPVPAEAARPDAADSPAADAGREGPIGNLPGDVSRAYARLADPDAEVRESAMRALMGLPVSRLEEFREVVAASQPADPAQEVVLRDIVGQIFLSGQAYQGSATSGFMGVSMTWLTPRSGRESTEGVVVIGRVQGFVAYPALSVGDVIVASGIGEPSRLASTEEFVRSIRGMRPGTMLNLRVIRGGRERQITLRLDKRPDAADADDPMVYEQFMAERQRQFDEYWQTHFASLVRRVVS